MHRYFIKMPVFVKRLFPRYVWEGPGEGNVVYLTFDDGPHPEVTPWVLDQLRVFDAQATFFCIGNNVVRHPSVMDRISAEGHGIGNHTYDHVNGWKTEPDAYLANVRKAASVIDSALFRPPYGRIRKAQARGIAEAMGQPGARIVLWDVLSADFDATYSPQQCADNVLRHTVAGSIIVFHDSVKAWPNLSGALPLVLRGLQERGFRFGALAGV
ncbi:polysaccharide deacetylase family protein [Flaviaesturariibacter amylovorans]|uniref:Polysaccharide deacetylase family protein n=1 Tax=Flaviaesturariibacter amylovorans TaxID=1084520 RepID=A0ABP8G7K4_9BACT